MRWIHMETSYIEPWDDKEQAYRRTLRAEQVSESPRPGFNLTVYVDLVVRVSDTEVFVSRRPEDNFSAGMTLDADQVRELYDVLGTWLDRSAGHEQTPLPDPDATVTDLSQKRARKHLPT